MREQTGATYLSPLWAQGFAVGFRYAIGTYTGVPGEKAIEVLLPAAWEDVMRMVVPPWEESPTNPFPRGKS